MLGGYNLIGMADVLGQHPSARPRDPATPAHLTHYFLCTRMMKAQAVPNMGLNGKESPYKSLHNLRIACLLLQGKQYILSGGRNSTSGYDYFMRGLPQP
ncbi:hypothetical protein CSQ88_18210 [Iodobacter sp. BJB302]|nr:hypothetical protein CSQ88_18210 [Iodobacter sp. BJB302]